MSADAYTLAKALDWVHRRLKEPPPIALLHAVDEAARQFDLSPRDEEWLLNQVRPPREGKDGKG